MRQTSKYKGRGRQKALPLKWEIAKQLIMALREDTIPGYSHIQDEHRFYAMVLLGFGTGMRATDLIHRTWDEFIGKDEKGYYPYEYIVLYENKKKHLKTVPSQRLPVFKSLQGFIMELFMTVNPPKHDGLIFAPRNARRADIADCWNRYKMYDVARYIFEEYELIHPTPFFSLMRCTWARAIYDHLLTMGCTVDSAINQVQRVMNHANPQTTAMYLGLGFYSDEIKSVVDTLSMGDGIPFAEGSVRDSLVTAMDELDFQDIQPAELDWDGFAKADRETVQSIPRLRARLSSFNMLAEIQRDVSGLK